MSETKRDGLQVLSDLTGVSRKGIESAFEQVKANKAKLEACALHDFEQIDHRFGSKWRCTQCQGEADSSAVTWYLRGLNHGKSGVDIK